MEPVATWARASLFIPSVPLKNSPQNIRGYTDIFTVYCTRPIRVYCTIGSADRPERIKLL